MTLYQLHHVEDKQPVASIGHARSWQEAIEEAQFLIDSGQVDEVWITDPTNPDNVLAVVDREGVYTG